MRTLQVEAGRRTDTGCGPAGQMFAYQGPRPLSDLRQGTEVTLDGEVVWYESDVDFSRPGWVTFRSALIQVDG